ncbi:ankyrin repeat-containing domain protein [Trichophaea hybrida]|nr:ankyrin repeat-containing domain protein [Trichophaea hybrida]
MENIWAPEHLSYTRFFEAVEEGNVDDLDPAVMSNINFNIDALRSNGQGSEGMAALHMAAGEGHVDMVQFLLDNGADIEIRDRDLTGDSTPLHHAAFDCQADVIRTLLENGADTRATGSFGGTALHQVLRDKFEVKQEHIETITLLLDCGLDINAELQLHQASRLKHTGLIKLLLDRGANIDAVNRVNCSVLGCAAAYGDYNTVEFLLDNGAKVDLPIGNSSALPGAAARGKLDIATLLLREIDESTLHNNRIALHKAASAGHAEMVDLLLDRSFNTEARDQCGDTPLLCVCAASQAYPKVIASLLSRGADVMAKGSNGDTACKPSHPIPEHLTHRGSVHKAVWRSDPEVVQLLLEANTDINAQNDDGETPLIIYATNISGHCLNFFHSHGKGRNLRLEVFKLLLDADANVNARDNKGRTALHALMSRPASRHMARGRFMAVRLLVEAGVEINARDKDGKTAYQSRVRRSEPDLAQFLRDSGAGE